MFALIFGHFFAVRGDDRGVATVWAAGAIAVGFGTIASRSTVTLSSAIHHASTILREKAFAIAANMLAQAGYKRVYNIVDGMEGDRVDDPGSAFHGKPMRNGWKNSGASMSDRRSRARGARSWRRARSAAA